MVVFKLSGACNLNVVLTVSNIRVSGDSKSETAPHLASRRSTEGLTSSLISLGKPRRQNMCDRDGSHKLQFDEKNKNKHNKLCVFLIFVFIEYKGRKFVPQLIFLLCSLFGLLLNCCSEYSWSSNLNIFFQEKSCQFPAAMLCMWLQEHTAWKAREIRLWSLGLQP